MVKRETAKALGQVFMKIAVLKETMGGERRVAVTPDVVAKYLNLGFRVVVEKSAGERACFSDSAYVDKGAELATSAKNACAGADIVVKVNAPQVKECDYFKAGQVLIAHLDSYHNRDLLVRLGELGVDAVAMELMPRITRAQSMDILSSQNNIAGYKAVIAAADYLASAFPLMMTAAGTVAPVKLMVMGVGVAGLQAIATARRLGAVVSATDVRPATKEQVESLGGKFIAVEDAEFLQAQTEAGYAKPMSEAYQKKQAAFLKQVIVKQDIVITTALIPGMAAPRLIDDEMLGLMKPGSLVVDLAAVAGGNCVGCEKGKTIVREGVTIIGVDNYATQVPHTTSALLAKNIFAFINQFTDKDQQKLILDSEDEIIRQVLTMRAGQFFAEPLKALWG